jgi:hypothetical protein
MAPKTYSELASEVERLKTEIDRWRNECNKLQGELWLARSQGGAELAEKENRISAKQRDAATGPSEEQVREAVAKWLASLHENRTANDCGHLLSRGSDVASGWGRIVAPLWHTGGAEHDTHETVSAWDNCDSCGAPLDEDGQDHCSVCHKAVCEGCFDTRMATHGGAARGENSSPAESATTAAPPAETWHTPALSADDERMRSRHAGQSRLETQGVAPTGQRGPAPLALAGERTQTRKRNDMTRKQSAWLQGQIAAIHKLTEAVIATIELHHPGAADHLRMVQYPLNRASSLLEPTTETERTEGE